MKIEIMELSERKAKLVISDIYPSIANAIRRDLMAEVPKMAIEDVEYHLGPIRDDEGNEFESVSPLFDEIIAHRLGLVPVPTDIKNMVPRDECSCDGTGCPSCAIMYTLNKKGPAMVYSGDLEPLGDATLAPTEKKIPIVKLGEGQALLIYVTAALGKGKDHVKWQVTQAVGYKYYPILEIDSDKCNMCGDCVTECPVNILSDKKGNIEVEDLVACTLCKSCSDTCSKDAIQIKSDPKRIIFHFETDGSVTPQEALVYALGNLKEQFANITEIIDKL
jgi:DNA-directed RNA polymerase subunit D